MTTSTDTPTSAPEAIVRQRIAKGALDLFSEAQRQKEQAEGLYAAAKKFFEEVNKGKPFYDRLYENEMRECSFYDALDEHRRRLEKRGDEIAMESRAYVDFLTSKVLDAMPDLADDADALYAAYGDYCKKLAKTFRANLDNGSIPGYRADRARKFIGHYLGERSTLK